MRRVLGGCYHPSCLPTEETEVQRAISCSAGQPRVPVPRAALCRPSRQSPVAQALGLRPTGGGGGGQVMLAAPHSISSVCQGPGHPQPGGSSALTPRSHVSPAGYASRPAAPHACTSGRPSLPHCPLQAVLWGWPSPSTICTGPPGSAPFLGKRWSLGLSVSSAK